MSVIRLHKNNSGSLTGDYLPSSSANQFSLTSHIHDGLYVPASGGTFTGGVTGTFVGDGSSLTGLTGGESYFIHLGKTAGAQQNHGGANGTEVVVS